MRGIFEWMMQIAYTQQHQKYAKDKGDVYVYEADREELLELLGNLSVMCFDIHQW